ncbi:hypothetical protein EN814_16320 [Mesorhizobium sp. M2D.F.Ca.ET.171.01.1.1]|uniref:hypothetical protein n=1 Tax=unclassified Mesorhizobium TaxID=325217 RepID=UPI00109189AA|nr:MULTISPECIES: hypothetical protein [unclassified Mesorhizobium]TGS95267.1 hypothetical protein EN821_16335 [Mesorhizobium sp. M2D.F.Ca.ET.178.01.1.1]TGT10806.1 hypothetical protein EN814_16320 [Mesorhizobium sp. M2D.F.Ca.ET.171.01.1.1]
MPAFFVPAATSDQQAKAVLEAVAKFNHLENPNCFYSISYTQNSKREVAVVGEHHVVNGEVVIFILKAADGSGPYLICTENRGVARGGPILADGSWRTNATPFTVQ